MSIIDEALMRAGVTTPFEALPTYERERILTLLNAAKTNTLTLEHVKTHIYGLKLAVEQELTEIHDTPQNWLGVLALLIPLVGIIRKWYLDQRTMELHARLRNYVLIYNIFTNPKQAEDQLNMELANLARSIKQTEAR